MRNSLIPGRSARLRPLRWMLVIGLIASAGTACGAADDSTWEEEEVDNATQQLVVVEGLTVTFGCNPPTGTGIVTRRCHILFGDGNWRENIPPGNFTHTYASYGTYTYRLTEQYCTRPDCSFGFGSGSRTADVDIMLVPPPSGEPPSGSINLPGSFQGFAGKGLNMRATGGPFGCCNVDWHFGDGTKDLGDNEAVTHTYNSTGTFTVRANLRANGTTIASDTAPVTIYACQAYADCTIQGGMPTYTCWNGFRDTGSICVDYNECAGENGGDDCNSSSRCDNTPGSFRCVACPAGYRSDSAGTGCVDRDECATGTDNCDYYSRCANTAGSFSCHRCQNGYRADPATNGTSCVDINECIGEGNGQHCVAGAAACTNTAGSYRCTCPSDRPFGNGFVCFTSQADYDAHRIATCNAAEQSCFNSCRPWGGASCQGACGTVAEQCMASSSW